jgi:4,5-dihydroxyphthalate decarboxylase
MDAITGYCHEQGLIDRSIPFDELFVATFQGRKRGDEFRF